MTTMTTQALETQVRLVAANILETSLRIAETTESLEVKLAEANTQLVACNTQTQLATLDRLNLELCELESERLWYEQNATADLTALAEIDDDIQGVKDLIQSARYRVRTQS